MTTARIMTEERKAQKRAFYQSRIAFAQAEADDWKAKAVVAEDILTTTRRLEVARQWLVA